MSSNRVQEQSQIISMNCFIDCEEDRIACQTKTSSGHFPSRPLYAPARFDEGLDCRCAAKRLQLALTGALYARGCCRLGPRQDAQARQAAAVQRVIDLVLALWSYPRPRLE